MTQEKTEDNTLDKLTPENFPKQAPLWAAECNRIAREKGWWEDAPRPHSDLVFLMVTELAEAFEEYRRPDLDVNEIYFGPAADPANPDPETRKPEGVPVEIADVIIRAFDFIGQLAETGGGLPALQITALDAIDDYKPTREAVEKENLSGNFMALLRPLCMVNDYLAGIDGHSQSRNARRAIRGLMGVIVYLLAMGEKMEMDLHAALTKKLAFNKTRPHRHGGKKV